MTVYALCELEISDLGAMQPYLDAVAGTIAASGGKYLVAAGKTEVIEGGIGEYPVKVVLEFPSAEAAKAWYNSEEYQAILPFRRRNSRSNLYLMEGGAP
jgi:uncharacterized protein (DUF1330 family)